MGCARSGLFPLLLLSKLVSELDVLPGQFEVASPPPVLPTYKRPGAKAGLGDWGEGDRAIVIKGLVRGKKDPPPSRAQVLARILARVYQHLSYSLGEPRKSILKKILFSLLTSIPTRKRHPIAIWPPEMPSLMF